MRMIEDMKLAGLSAKTQEVYLQAVIALVKRYGNRSPDQLTEEEVRRYLLEVRERNARGTFKARHYGIQFFYRNTLCKDWVSRDNLGEGRVLILIVAPQEVGPRLRWRAMRTSPGERRRVAGHL